MTQSELIEMCPVCEQNRLFMFSGSGKKAVCEWCKQDFEVTIRKVGKSFKRIEDYENGS